MFSSRLNIFGYLFKEHFSRDPICRMELQEWPRNLWRLGCHIFLSTCKITSEIQRSEIAVRTGERVLLYGKEKNGRNNTNQICYVLWQISQTWVLLQPIICSQPWNSNMGFSCMHKCSHETLPAPKHLVILTLCRCLYWYIHSGQSHTCTQVYHLFKGKTALR